MNALGSKQLKRPQRLREFLSPVICAAVILLTTLCGYAQQTGKPDKKWHTLTEYDSLVINKININSPYDETSPVMKEDGRLYFNSDRRNPFGQQAALAYNDQLYVSHKTDTGWVNPEITYFFNTDDQTGLAGLNADLGNLFIYKTFGNGDLYVSHSRGDRWGVPERLRFPVNSDGHEQSAFEINGYIYFSSERQAGMGQHDIYRARKDESGRYTDLVALHVLNSPYDEVDVSLSPDGTLIFFSSNRPNDNYGGYDIYFSSMDSEGNWSPPKNLHSPINSPDNERYFFDCDSVFFMASNRPGGLGGYDIYEGAYVPALDPFKKNLLYVDISLLQKDTMLLLKRNKYVKMDEYIDSIGFRPHYAMVQIGAFYGMSVEQFRSHYPKLKSTPITTEKSRTAKGTITKFLVDVKFNTLLEAAAMQKQMRETHRITDAFIVVYFTEDNKRIAIFNTVNDEFILLVGDQPPVKF